jgi:dsRNA-specific ribonuclease
MTDNSNIYLGSRGDDFKQLIHTLLSRGKLKPKYIDMLTGEDSMRSYGYAFTASSADLVNNYERFEQMGDLTANKFIVWYAYKRFPQLDCTQGVKVAARLRINYGAKAVFAPLADKLGFWNFISSAEDGTAKNMKYRNRHKKDLLEDTLEAFIGCTEYLLDQAYRPGVGYGIVYDILTDIFNEIHISLKYEDLFDAKTRLKETFDVFTSLGTWAYIDSREEVADTGYTVATATVYRDPTGTSNKPIEPCNKQPHQQPRRGWIKLGKGTASNKGDAQQQAAQMALKTLAAAGFYRTPPAEYQYFCTGK